MKCRFLIAILIVPSETRLQDLLWHSGTFLRNGQPEEIVLNHLHLFEMTPMNGIDDGAGISKGDPLTGPESATDPSRVDQPGVSRMLIHFFREHLCVLVGVPYEERRSETC